jgi:ATP-dependent Clp protease ATP-binding subunit ClpA
MYERFTVRARKVMWLANEEAKRLYHEYVGTEHILLGLVKEGAGVAAIVLKNLDIRLPKIRLEVEKIVQAGPDLPTLGKLPLTPRAKKVVEYARDEGRNLNHNYVGTEHLLLGLLREQEGVAAQVLMNLGLRLEDARQEVLTLLGWRLGQPVTRRALPPVGLQDLPAEEFPAEIRPALLELDPDIEALTQEKEEAIAEQDFEKAAHFRDQAQVLKEKRKAILLEWRKRHLPDPSWLTWNGGTVAALAKGIDQEGRWGELPGLADALAKAGCTDHEILSHCREHAEHERGCWVVALLLGKL